MNLQVHFKKKNVVLYIYIYIYIIEESLRTKHNIVTSGVLKYSQVSYFCVKAVFFS
jgi:hypothetical protein